MSGEIPYSAIPTKPMPLPRNSNIIVSAKPPPTPVNSQQQQRAVAAYEFSSDDTNSQNSSGKPTKSTIQSLSHIRNSDSSVAAPQQNAIVKSSGDVISVRSRSKKKKNTMLTTKSREHSLENQLSLLSNIVQHKPTTATNEFPQHYSEQMYTSSADGSSYSYKVPVKNHAKFEQGSMVAGIGGTSVGSSTQHHTKPAVTNMKTFDHTSNYQQPYPSHQTDAYQLRNEIVELRNQSMQMEKTLQWWSDCTASWRDKWAKVKSERNKAREELKRQKGNEAELVRELMVLRQQRQLLIQENKNLKHQVDYRRGGGDAALTGSMSDHETSSNGSKRSKESMSTSSGAEKQKKDSGGAVVIPAPSRLDEDEMAGRMAALQLKVEESGKTIQAERDAKVNLNKRIEELEQELSTLKQKHDEIKTAKQETLKQMTRIQESHRAEIVRLNESVEEEMENRSQLEKKVQDLREEVERLQGENTSEWGRRERTETEKLQLERDNKRLKSINDELKAAMGRKCKAVVEDRDNELKQAHAQLQEFNEDLTNLRRQAGRDQKMLQERNEELSHSRRRAEQHEAEVRQLRGRIEELKKQQTQTEDEMDNVQNQHRKLLRVVEEKEEEVEKLQLQYDQAQTRMRHEARSKSTNNFLRSTKGDSTESDSDS